VPDNESVNIFVYEVVAVIFLIHIFTSSVNCVCIYEGSDS
jgi:hypothetical protein